MQKLERHSFIRDLINNEPIRRQSVIAEKLAARGLVVTQASVSRDLEELGISKQNGVYKVTEPTTNGEIRLSSIEAAGVNLLVGKCPSGLASAITVRIDAGKIPEIVGTIAGDDTVFIAVRGVMDQTTAIAKIMRLFDK